MKEFVIQKDDANQRVDKFIMKTMKTMPKSLMYKYIRNKKIKVNRKRCEISQRLQEGDTAQCFIAEEFFENKKELKFLKVPSKVNCLYEDNNIILLCKPSGLLVHSDTKELQDNLADRYLHYLYEKKEYDPEISQSFTPALCHRIDRNTEGIVIAAKNAEALREMNNCIKERKVDKYYLCIVEGKMETNKSIIEVWHKKFEDNHVEISKDKKDGYQKVVTGYKVLSEKNGFSLLEVELITGKSHQIRAVMSFLGNPLYGDIKYGAKRNGRQDYQALCAYKVNFHTENNSILSYLDGKEFMLQDTGVEKIYKNL